MAVFVVIGISSSLSRKNTTDDYLLAGRNVPPWLVALSAVATNNSGFMFIGMIAYTYRVGIESVWMMIGWVVGDLMAWQLVHPRVRKESEAMEVATIPALLGTSRAGEKRIIIILGGGGKEKTFKKIRKENRRERCVFLHSEVGGGPLHH